MKKIIIALICTLLILLSVYAYSLSKNPSDEVNLMVHNEIVSANTEFGFNLFDELLKEDLENNIFISPLSITFALTMTYNGSADKTRKAMAKALEYEDFGLDIINETNAALMKILPKADKKVKLHIANSIWAKKGSPFKKEFIKENKKLYNAEIKSFKGSKDADAINKWVSKQTKGKIKQIITYIDPSMVMYLINAIYFKGSWTDEFDESRTREKDFYLLDESTKKVMMMHNDDKYSYFENDMFQAIRLPYGEGRLGMYIFLPHKNDKKSLKKFYGKLNIDNWNKWLGQFKMLEGDISLPRFKLEYSKSLNDVLKELGMDIAFKEGKADFTNMFNLEKGMIWIDEVKHKTFIEVNEKGTEAAAVTSVGMQVTSAAPSSERFSMIVDHPFFLAIVDDDTNTILFIGSITNPSE